MDAEILALRNRLLRRFRLRDPLAGYPLYLLSCAALLLRRRRLEGVVQTNGTAVPTTLVNLLVLNAAVYAGEFRFDAEPHDDDGLLDVLELASVNSYVRTYVTAWSRYVRYRNGAKVHPPIGLSRVDRLRVEFPQQVPTQLDGEEGESARCFDVSILPRRVDVCVPRRSLVSLAVGSDSSEPVLRYSEPAERARNAVDTGR